MKILLKLKAWQPFSIFFAMSLTWFLFELAGNFNELFFKFKSFLLILIYALFFLWIWLLGVGINKIISEKIRPQLKLFKIGTIYSFCIFIATIPFMPIDYEKNPIYLLFLPAMLLALFCLIYAIYYIAKNIVMAEKKRNVTFKEIEMTFFLLLFFWIGIWVIQPRLNKLV